jgi:chromosome segregation ATPase
VTVSTTSHNHQSNRKKQQQQQQITPKKRHQSAVYIKHVPTDTASNLISVNLKSYKQPKHQQQQQLDQNQNQLIQNLEKSQKEIENLRHLLTERNELIEIQKRESDSKQKELVKLNESKLNDLKNNDNLLKQLEEQKGVILNLKTKLTKLNKEGNLDSDTMSSISNSLDRVRQNVKQNLKKYDSKQSNSRKSSVDASVQADTPPTFTSSTSKQQQSDLNIEATSLVCNIPEHHRLEDLLHDNREYIAKLKVQIKSSQNLNEMTLLDKKAEFEALDLAINTRKQQLYNLELAKNRKLNEQNNDDVSYTSNDTNLLKEEINCLEQTLRKRNKELDQLQMQIKNEKKELQQLADSKFNIEKDLDSLKRKYNIINKEINIYDRKAEEATINLIVAQEELDWTKDLKKTIEYDVEKIKTELVNYLRRLKANNFETTSSSKYQSVITNPDFYLTEIEQKKLIDEQKFQIDELNNEIESKKYEIESMKEQSQTYFKQFRSEIEKNEIHLLNTKKSHEVLQCEINEMKQLLDELNSETKLKQQSLHDKNVLVETLELSIKKFKTINEEESKKLDDLESKLAQSYNEYENVDKKFKKLCENINLLQAKESELTSSINKLNNDINIEKQEYERLKQTNDVLNMNKNDLESKCAGLNDALDKMNEELNDREQQLNKILNLSKEKHALLKQDEEQLADLEYEKENLNQETNLLKDKLNRKKIEYDRLEQNNKQLNEKFTQNETEINIYAHKLFEAKQNYEKVYNAVKEVDFKLKELNLKLQQKHGNVEQLNAELLDKKEEITGLDTFLDEIRRDTHQEKKELNSVKNEINKQKKIYEDLKAKCKNYVKFIENSENNMGKLQELTDDLNDKSKHIQELEMKLAEKNQEFNLLNQNFQKFQEDSLTFKHRLQELDDASKRNNLMENELKKFLHTLESDNHCSLNTRSTVLCVPKQRPSASQVSSLLIQPTIRKTYSSDLITEHCSIPKLTCADLLNEKTNTILDEQNKYKENLIEKFHEKLNNLDRSKCQTKSIIDNLKSNLNEIEAMTANSIFKLTGGNGGCLKN